MLGNRPSGAVEAHGRAHHRVERFFGKARLEAQWFTSWLGWAIKRSVDHKEDCAWRPLKKKYNYAGQDSISTKVNK